MLSRLSNRKVVPGRDAIADADKRRALVVDLWDETAIRYNHAGKKDSLQPIGSPVGHHQALKLSWEMFTAETGEVDTIRVHGHRNVRRLRLQRARRTIRRRVERT
jgi:hypothetical protein